MPFLTSHAFFYKQHFETSVRRGVSDFLHTSWKVRVILSTKWAQPPLNFKQFIILLPFKDKMSWRWSKRAKLVKNDGNDLKVLKWQIRQYVLARETKWETKGVFKGVPCYILSLRHFDTLSNDVLSSDVLSSDILSNDIFR